MTYDPGMGERSTERRGAPHVQAASPGIGIASPRHERLATLSESLSQAEPVQRLALLSSAINAARPVQRHAAPPPGGARLPAQLQAGIEAMSGIAMNDVGVHYNSPKPAQLHAHAYAQGSAIHLAPGQERHLPHEAWHVVQQKQGRVRATRQLKAGVPLNDDKGLEHEADVMGARSLQAGGSAAAPAGPAAVPTAPGEPVVQGVFDWLWRPVANLLGYGAPAPAGPGPGAGAGHGAVPVHAGPALAPVVAPAATPADIRTRLLAAGAVYTTAAATLPAVIRNGWAAAGEPAPVANEINVDYALIQHLAAFPPGAAAATADAATAAIEGRAHAYQAYCAAVLAKVTQACTMRANYLAHLTAPNIAAFTVIRNQTEQGGIPAATTIQHCDAFIAAAKISSAQTSAGLQAMMLANRVQAEALVTRYFAEGRLRIGSWRKGYTTGYDTARGRFGAEWTLRASDAGLADVAENWVFHTHAVADEAQNFTISRSPGASHIKPIAHVMAAGMSLNFVDNAEFARIENDPGMQKSFVGWVRRLGADVLRNTNKRH